MSTKRGRPRKKQRNISGLKSQLSHPSTPEPLPSDSNSNGDLEEISQVGVVFDSLRINPQAEEEEEQSDCEDVGQLDDFENEEYCERELLEMSDQDDQNDLEWLPPKIQEKVKAQVYSEFVSCCARAISYRP